MITYRPTDSANSPSNSDFSVDGVMQFRSACLVVWAASVGSA